MSALEKIKEAFNYPLKYDKTTMDSKILAEHFVATQELSECSHLVQDYVEHLQNRIKDLEERNLVLEGQQAKLSLALKPFVK